MNLNFNNYYPRSNQNFNQMNNQMNNQMLNQMFNQMNNQMFNQMNNQMFNQMNNQMFNQMNNQMINQMNNPMNTPNDRFSCGNPSCRPDIMDCFAPMNYHQNRIQSIPNQMVNQMNSINSNNMNNIPNYQNNISSFNQIKPQIFNNPNIQNINNNYLMKNKPIKGSKLSPKNSDNSSNIEYYEYPEITFTNKEEDDSKVVLLIGQTGTGKTTLINAMINIYLGITIDDDFRYVKPTKKNLEENPVKNNSLSDTKEITVYKIRPKEGLNFPPLKIVDTPGFGDTEGQKEDEKHFEKFKKCFQEELLNVNCICYIVKSSDCRFDDKQKYIFNCLMDLFDKNVNKNFMVGITYFFPSGDEEPNVIDIFKNNDFYFKNILNTDNLPKEEIFKTYWYFASDNKIIFENRIKRNNIEKEKWNYTEKEIKKFIENKIKILQAVTVKESGEILRIRNELKVENESLFSKIDQLFLEKEIYEYNKKIIENYKNELEEQENLIQKYREKKNKTIEQNSKIKDSIKNGIRPYLIKRMETKKTTYDNFNTLCQECQKNCHINCNCKLSDISTWFCHIISLMGKCKVCGHDKKSHLKEQSIYYQIEKIDTVENKELLNIISFSSIKEENNNNYINKLNDVENEISIYMNSLKNEKNDLEKKNKEYDEKILIIKMEIIKAYNRIKNNLDYLRKNALKEESITIDKYIEKSIEEINNDKKKQFFLDSLKTYNKLIEFNIDFPNLTAQEYKELKI